MDNINSEKKAFESDKNGERNYNKNQKEIINHCALNNAGLRKIYKDSYYNNGEKEISLWKNYNINSNKKDFKKRRYFT